MKRVLIAFLFLSLVSAKAQTQRIISSQWMAFRQTIDVQTPVKKKFRVIASAKVESNDPNAWCGVFARVFNKDEEPGFADNMHDRPIKSKE
jgi:hypothetical protein